MLCFSGLLEAIECFALFKVLGEGKLSKFEVVILKMESLMCSTMRRGITTFEVEERYFQQGMAWSSSVDRARKLKMKEAFKLDLGHVNKLQRPVALKAAFAQPEVGN